MGKGEGDRRILDPTPGCGTRIKAHAQMVLVDGVGGRAANCHKSGLAGEGRLFPVHVKGIANCNSGAQSWEQTQWVGAGSWVDNLGGLGQ